MGKEVTEASKTSILNPTEVRNGFRPMDWEFSSSKLLVHLRKAFLKKVQRTKDELEAAAVLRLH